MDEPRPDLSAEVHLLGREAEVPHARPRGGGRLHDRQREEVVRVGASQRVQHVLGALHLVHLQTAGGHQEGETSQSVRPGEHHEGVL